MSSQALLNLLQGKNSQPVPFQDPAIASVAISNQPPAAPAANKVNVNLNLNRSKETTPPAAPENKVKANGTKQTPEPASKPRFTYVNPFHALEASSPLKKFQTESSSSSSASVNSEPTRATPEPVAHQAPVDSAIVSAVASAPAAAQEEPKVEPQQETGPEPEPATKDSAQTVAGFKLPLAPRAGLYIDSIPISGSISKEDIDMIANFKRDTNQYDRNVIAVNDDFIAYSVPNGIRVLSQEDGSFTVLVGHEDSRITNVLISSYKSSSDTSLLVSTTASNEVIVWEILAKTFSLQNRSKQYRKLLRLEKLPPNSEHVPKSRVNWPPIADCVAISMSKSIYLFPLDAENFLDIRRSSLADRAGQSAIMIESELGSRDFAFSTDGTVLATVDKSGSVTVFDMSKLPALGEGAEKATIRHALAKFTPRANLRFTSIHFIDSPDVVRAKKPMRYLLLGYDQNNTFILWDLVSGEISEEIHLPGSPESVNGLAVSYGTGIVVVSNASQNVVMFLHLSFPAVGSDSSFDSQAALLKGPAARSGGTEPAGFDYVASYSFYPGNTIISFTLLEFTSDDALMDLYICYDDGALIFPVSGDKIAYKEWGAAAVLETASVRAIEPAQEADANSPTPHRTRSKSPLKKHSITPFGAMKAKSRSTSARKPSVPSALPTPSASPAPTTPAAPVIKEATPTPAAPVAREATPTPAPAKEATPPVAKEATPTPAAPVAREATPAPATPVKEEEKKKKRGAEDISTEINPEEKRQELDESEKGSAGVDEPVKVKERTREKREVKKEAKKDAEDNDESGITVPTSSFSFRPVTAAKRKAILTRESASVLGLPPPAASNAASSPEPAAAEPEPAAAEPEPAAREPTTATSPTSVGTAEKEATVPVPSAKEAAAPASTPAEKRRSRKEKGEKAEEKSGMDESVIAKITDSVSKTIETTVSAELRSPAVVEVVRRAIKQAVEEATQQLVVEVRAALGESAAEQGRKLAKLASAVESARAEQDRKLDDLAAVFEQLKKRDRKIEVLSETLKGLL